MRNLLQLFIRNGGFVTFVLLEVFCFYLVVKFNTEQNAIFTYSAGIFGGNMLEKRQQMLDYVGLNARVDSLLKENGELQSQLANARVVQMPYRDTFFTVLYDTLNRVDSIRRRAVRPDYAFIAGRVIGNSISGANNWLIINKGSNDGLRPNMAVVTRKGVAGILRHVDPDFSMAMSVLHRQVKISASLPKHENAFGSLVWEGGDPSLMTLKFIPKHIKVLPGEPVVTSGVSLMFPKDIPVGVVEGEPEQDPENPYFLLMRVRLNQDMSTVSDVYLVNNLFGVALDTLQAKAKNE